MTLGMKPSPLDGCAPSRGAFEGSLPTAAPGTNAGVPPSGSARRRTAAGAVALVGQADGLPGDRRAEDRGDEVDEVAHEEPVVDVRAGGGPPPELRRREA